ncbi:hypothetical protein BDV30DRAFT_205950 [Aspergillus minisclerotigenes]|uniref:Uncharacterized protein n=1 Tax=Aspergillus minisclerotigenes TaxID=656917 RepID=A0A5N6JCZ8_9EURO|nr:hypothetical protein BDV30DRAFT_205950 [Aspergillus minisclerotigenes]
MLKRWLPLMAMGRHIAVHVAVDFILSKFAKVYYRCGFSLLSFSRNGSELPVFHVSLVSCTCYVGLMVLGVNICCWLRLRSSYSKQEQQEKEKKKQVKAIEHIYISKSY